MHVKEKNDHTPLDFQLQQTNLIKLTKLYAACWDKTRLSNILIFFERYYRKWSFDTGVKLYQNVRKENEGIA